MRARVEYPLNRNHLIYDHFSIESFFFFSFFGRFFFGVKCVHYLRYDYFMGLFLVHDFHISCFYWETSAKNESLNVCIGKWRITCKWVVIYSQHRPSAAKFFLYSQYFDIFSYSHADLWIYALYIYVNVFYTIKFEQFDLYKISKKKEKEWKR